LKAFAEVAALGELLFGVMAAVMELFAL